MTTDPQQPQSQTNLAPDKPDVVPERPLVKKQKKEKKKKASKGVETLFRTTLSSHIKLSEMADRKANLMISINTIIISIIISAYVRKYDAPENLLVPSILLLMVCLLTIVVSLLATNPIVSPTAKRATASKDAPIDLLFFGDYARLTADEYRLNVLQLLSNEENLYTSLIDNIYAQGQVLSRKYQLLKFAYQFFMVGFSVVVLLVVLMLLSTY